MFNFFCNLAMAIYFGKWYNLQPSIYIDNFISYLGGLPIFNIFNNSVDQFYTSAGSVWVGTFAGVDIFAPQLALTIAVILSTICCISVFFIIVKAVKKLFTCFLDR